MPIIDRYIVMTFIKIFVICFISFAGLFIIVDAFTNLEEFLDLAQSRAVPEVIGGYYTPRVLQFFDRTAPMLALVAAIFALALMQRTNELTAIAAAGISNRRVARPIMIVAAGLILLTVLNRELLIPNFRNQLVMDAQDLSMGKARSIGLTVDHSTGIVIRGKEVMPADQTIQEPVFSLPLDLADCEGKIMAGSARYLTADEHHPPGFLLSKVADDNTSRHPDSKNVDGKTMIYRASQNSWLKPDQVFIVTDVDTMEMAFSKELARYASLGEMIDNSRQPSVSFSNQSRVDLHARIVQPVFDMTILLIGLPLVIARGERNLFVSSGICLGVVMLMVLVVIACHSMGASRIVSPPSLAAWLPLIIFLPVAAVTWRLLEQ